MTPRELIRRTAEAFRAAGVPDPEVDASLLLSDLTGKPPLLLRTDDWTELSESLSPEELILFEVMAERRKMREPLQYILHTQSFLGHSFFVDERVLIPRPETELMTERAISVLRQKGPGAVALDLCCGSGCIAISMALAVPQAQIHACDLSRDALMVARRNAGALHAHVTAHQGDLFEAIGWHVFDVIVSNPPYIPTADCATLQQEVLSEPVMALDGGPDGLDFYRRIAREAPSHMHPDGVLLLEVGDGQADDVLKLLEDAGFHDIKLHKDYQLIQRIVEARI